MEEQKKETKKKLISLNETIDIEKTLEEQESKTDEENDLNDLND